MSAALSKLLGQLGDVGHVEDVEGPGRRCSRRRGGCSLCGRRRLLLGGGLGGGARLCSLVALAEDAALQERVEGFGCDQHELGIAGDLLADRLEPLLARIGDGDHRTTALDPDRHGAHLARIDGVEQRVSLSVDRQAVAGTELELALLGERGHLGLVLGDVGASGGGG